MDNLKPMWLIAALFALGSACSEGKSSTSNADTQNDSGDQTGIDTDTENDTPDANTDDDTSDADPVFDPHPLDSITTKWFPCSLIENEDDGLAECASTPMPLFWEDSSDIRTLEIYSKRLFGSGEGNTQLWLLHGGPGASGVDGLPKLMVRLQKLFPELDVYTLDHRGVGRSGLLRCPDQESEYSDAGESIAPWELAPCIEDLKERYGDEFNAYTATLSAYDLAALIEDNREVGKDVLVWGGSYGTYLAHRYVEIFPEQADGLVLEGISPADASFVFSGEGFDQAGIDLFELCREDPFCTEKLGSDPLGKAKEVLSLLQSRALCQKMGSYADYLPYVIVYLLYYHPFHSIIPSAIFRADRCSEQDREALSNLVEFIFGDNSTFMDLGDRFSTILYKHVVYSEMWEHPQFADADDILRYLYEVESDQVFGSGSGSGMHEEYEAWPHYTDKRWDNKWATTDIPMLMLQGELDPTTHYNRAISMTDHFNAPNQHFISFPTTPHNVSSGTPVSIDPDETHCGMQLFVDFIKDPTGKLNISCVANVLPNNFEGDEELAQSLYGTANLWGESQSPATKNALTQTSTELRSEWRSLRDEIRRRVSLELPLLKAELSPKKSEAKQ